MTQTQFKKPKPIKSIDPELERKIDAFGKGADQRALNIVEPTEDWRGFDKAAKPSKGINLRVNDYELGLIRSIAQKEDRSAQKVLRRMLIPILENRETEL